MRLLAGCASASSSLVPTPILSTCPAVMPFRLPPNSPRTNGDLLAGLDHTEAAWAEYAAQIDRVSTKRRETSARLTSPAGRRLSVP
ncbi:Rz1-like lysis system protein LysC [Azotobacter armeniacus]